MDCKKNVFCNNINSFFNYVRDSISLISSVLDFHFILIIYVIVIVPNLLAINVHKLNVIVDIKKIIKDCIKLTFSILNELNYIAMEKKNSNKVVLYD